MSHMKIQKAETKDYPRIRAFYHALIDALEHAAYRPGWKKDIYPDPEDLKKQIRDGCLYYGTENDELISAMVVNQTFQDDAYADANWSVPAADDEVLVMHMLGVHSEYMRRGVAGEMVRFAAGLAKKKGMKALRLDVMKGNVPAEKLYPRLGFSYINTIPMFYPDVGWMDFLLFELPITP